MIQALEEENAVGQEPGGRLRLALRLLRRMLIYHAVLAVALILIALAFPGLLAQLPIGGVSELVASGDATLSLTEGSEIAGTDPAAAPAEPGEVQIFDSLLRATGELDRLGSARQLVIVLVGLWLLMLPVSWVHKGIHRSSLHDHSLDETTLILPGVVAAIVLVVQHSLALAFSLAGIIAGVQFRRALQDTFDALFILVAIGAGIAAGVEALEISAVLTVFFSYATLYVYFFGDGLESDFEARKKLEKRLRREMTAADPDDPPAEPKRPD